MVKRPAEPEQAGSSALKGGKRTQPSPHALDDAVQFQDEFEDEFESDDEIFEAGEDGLPDDEREEEDEKNDAMELDEQIFIPGRNELAAGETLSPDPTTYHMLHTLSTTWPCLSFDILRDNLGDDRKTYPATVYAVAGTQAEGRRSKDNELMVMKLSGLGRMEQHRDPDDLDEDESDDEDIEPILESRSLPLSSTTNRVRAHQTTTADSLQVLTASLAESSEVLIHDITPHLISFDTPGTSISPAQNRPLSTLRMHKAEGYALDWSPLHAHGKLITGDNNGLIYCTTRSDSGAWTTDSRPFAGHASSIEELQWSPSEQNVFASASSDGSVKIWDLRSKSHTPALSVRISNTDVNVMSWSRQTHHLLATGADDGEWAVWDLRQWKPAGATGAAALQPTAVARFDFHKQQITSIEWHPTDDSLLAVAAGDDTLTLWDLAVELDDEESRVHAGVADIPAQLLFVHYMELVKECHWHPQIPGVMVATGGNGFG
ncbi:MAG: ribosome biosynthesis protein rrb1 [Trizodia sp. TS-e1964]|nr:MAG: ribosome biosynthesis protein rrb1 [Trizodia sp. TS-e1964]